MLAIERLLPRNVGLIGQNGIPVHHPLKGPTHLVITPFRALVGFDLRPIRFLW
jgi:hypothetical protein